MGQNNALCVRAGRQAAGANHHVTTRPPSVHPAPPPLLPAASQLTGKARHASFVTRSHPCLGQLCSACINNVQQRHTSCPGCMCILRACLPACLCTPAPAAARSKATAAAASGAGLSLVNSRFCLSLSRRIAQRLPRCPFDKRRRNKTMPNEKPSHEVHAHSQSQSVHTSGRQCDDIQCPLNYLTEVSRGVTSDGLAWTRPETDESAGLKSR